MGGTGAHPVWLRLPSQQKRVQLLLPGQRSSALTDAKRRVRWGDGRGSAASGGQHPAGPWQGGL